ncbi:ArsR/SmtB family transcription factor [Phenylobacterium sp. 58.2.17]|uniref:ArsR/SmtB family transcription factor n=1 Tax=Phenylobacterium sp. 58.2.17 TaxID=2969306 RepID=UPI00086CC3BF|nr:metalloregulator ArsR/SmtB family transcription factor [Phenylobacterium sp. 58.2.17]MCX7586297.1 metalloregulator ArsR/SmtB family transcription factor [Phenylobacterium sp. 58.2.17]ODT57460.1 MAG: ArsR family transcriptional regulator [Phenylobacterium sp. SCN 69-14]
MAIMFDLANFDITRFEASAGEAAKLLRALANERRLMILCQLADGELSVGELVPRVGLSQSALSQHLAVLREEAIVATRRDGQTIWYRIIDPAAVRVVTTLAEIFCPPDIRKSHDRQTYAPDAE